MDGESKRNGIYWLMVYTLFIVMVGPNLPSPLYEIYRKLWHLSTGTISLLFATYPLALIPSLMLAGPLSDRIGRRRLIIPSLLMLMLGSICFASAHTVVWLFVARAFQGIAVGSAIATLTAYLVELHPRQQHNAATVHASLAVASGGAVGPLLAGMLAQFTFQPIVMPYLVHLGLLGPAFLAAWSMPETVAKRSENRRRYFPSWHLLSSLRATFVPGSIAAFLAWSVIALFVALAPTYVGLLLHINALIMTGSIVFLLLGASAATQVLLRNLYAPRAIFYGIAFLLPGLGCVVAAVPLHAPGLLLLGMVINGIGHGLTWMGSLALVTLSAPFSRRAEVLAGFYVAMYLGVALPVIGIGFLSEAIGLYGAFLVFAGAVWILGIGLLLLLKRVSLRSLASPGNQG
ncbi:MFS transporter [Ktedonosporobacter rubrisoli]|uniref:MFS transporter n=1 Tax=Ktedonosporobacter rubrisoli TaxID=2509675 RepID=A0A4P6JNR6_KTERU|nr:MFS transporter [Ktedonosporobacter rubrisoli]QBD76958.1 MFS transporter [Ktedonosporobacter rubrisoli]